MKDRTLVRLIGAYMALTELKEVRRYLPIGKDVRPLVVERCNHARKAMVACMGGTAQLRGLMPIINGDQLTTEQMYPMVARAMSRVVKVIERLELTA